MRRIYAEFVSANVIGVTVKHNGFQGGDSGHGGFVTIIFNNITCTDMQINGKPVDKFELTIKGSTERQTFLDAFKMIVKELEEHTSDTE